MEPMEASQTLDDWGVAQENLKPETDLIKGEKKGD
jgi:hypothetical protein